MHEARHAHTLRPSQSRLVNATEGFRLEVRSGAIWLTRPGDPQDHFLTAGAAIDLHENLVLIQSDSRDARSQPAPARYALVPLHAPAADRRGGFAASLKSLLQRLGAIRAQRGAYPCNDGAL